MSNSNTTNTAQFVISLLVGGIFIYLSCRGLKFVSSARNVAPAGGIPGDGNGTIVQILLWVWIVTLVLEMLMSLAIYTGVMTWEKNDKNDY